MVPTAESFSRAKGKPPVALRAEWVKSQIHVPREKVPQPAERSQAETFKDLAILKSWVDLEAESARNAEPTERGEGSKK